MARSGICATTSSDCGRGSWPIASWIRRCASSGAEFEQRSGVVTVVDVDAGIAAELASIASDVVQVTREALSNVGRHAEATTCRVSLRRGAEGAILVIDDDGRGFESGTAGEGLGIGNLRDRVASLGGSLDILSTAGEGTTVRAVLPL